MRFCDSAITPLARAWLTGLTLRRQSAASFGEIDFARILNEAKRLVCLSFRCFAFFFRINCHHKEHWARLIDSCGRGTWHAVARVTLTRVTFCGWFQMFFLNSNARPLYSGTMPLHVTGLLWQHSVVLVAMHHLSADLIGHSIDDVTMQHSIFRSLLCVTNAAFFLIQRSHWSVFLIGCNG